MADDNQDQGVINDGAEEPQEGAPASEQPSSPEPEQPEVEQDDPQDTPDAAEGDQGEEQETTDRGTKVAKEPESQFYQKLKNENGDMRRLLSDPKSLADYLRRLEGTNAPEQGEEDDLGDIADKVLDQEGKVDVTKLVKYIDERQVKKLEQGMKYLSQDMDRNSRLQRSYDDDKAAVRQAHPELDPRNKERFDPELEQVVADRFIAQGGLEGKVTLGEVVEGTFTYLNKLRGSAKQQAETEVVRRQTGSIAPNRTPAKGGNAEEGMTPEQKLAHRVQNALAGK